MEFSREICVALPTHHALTGSDSTSFIHGIGKEKSYKIFEQDEVYTDAFSLLGEFEVVPPNVIDLLVQFICHLHNLPEHKDIDEVDTKDSDSAEPKRKSTLKHFRQQKMIFFYT